MKWLRLTFRLLISCLILIFGTICIILSAWLPIHWKGVRLSMWVLKVLVSIILFILNVRVECTNPEKLRNFHGFIFPNHVSYVDILVLLSVTPMRFLAKVEVRSWPVIGLIARAIGCVFVKRDDKQSRIEARAALAAVNPFPPIVLFPEGKRGPGHEMLPFRYGAFEIVTSGGQPFLPCVIRYSPLEVAIWRRSEHILKAVLRLAGHKGPLYAYIIPLTVIHPSPEDDPILLSKTTYTAMAAVEQSNNPSTAEHSL